MIKINTLEVFRGEEIVFKSTGNWIYPVFEFLDFIEKENNYAAEELFAIDKVIGKAAAVLFVKSGIKRVHGMIVSKHALEVFALNNVKCTYLNRVEAIRCLTEETLKEKNDISDCYDILLEKKRMEEGTG